MRSPPLPTQHKRSLELGKHLSMESMFIYFEGAFTGNHFLFGEVIFLSNDKISIKISKDLYEEIKRKIESKKDRFGNVDEYIENILRRLIKDEMAEVYTEEEEKQVMDHLKDLGYI